jgi:aspartyl-tRNA synthetase
MERFGTDKPDLRYEMEIADLSDVVAGSEFRVFQDVLENGGTVRGLCAPQAGSPSRKDVDELTAIAELAGAKGVIHLATGPDGLEGPTARFLNSEQLEGIRDRLGAKEGDLVLLVADQWRIALMALGDLRVAMAERLGLSPDGEYRFAWVHAFPLLEWDEETGRMTAVHHPFTSARGYSTRRCAR